MSNARAGHGWRPSPPGPGKREIRLSISVCFLADEGHPFLSLLQVWFCPPPVFFCVLALERRGVSAPNVESSAFVVFAFQIWLLSGIVFSARVSRLSWDCGFPKPPEYTCGTYTPGAAPNVWVYTPNVWVYTPDAALALCNGEELKSPPTVARAHGGKCASESAAAPGEEVSGLIRQSAAENARRIFPRTFLGDGLRQAV